MDALRRRCGHDFLVVAGRRVEAPRAATQVGIGATAHHQQLGPKDLIIKHKHHWPANGSLVAFVSGTSHFHHHNNSTIHRPPTQLAMHTSTHTLNNTRDHSDPTTTQHPAGARISATDPAPAQSPRPGCAPGTGGVDVMSSPAPQDPTVCCQTLCQLHNQCKLPRRSRATSNSLDATSVRERGRAGRLEHPGHHGLGGESARHAVLLRAGPGAAALAELQLVLVENVGDLVCPAEFDVGGRRAMVFSVTEGEDKLETPVMFRISGTSSWSTRSISAPDRDELDLATSRRTCRRWRPGRCMPAERRPRGA